MVLNKYTYIKLYNYSKNFLAYLNILKVKVEAEIIISILIKAKTFVLFYNIVLFELIAYFICYNLQSLIKKNKISFFKYKKFIKSIIILLFYLKIRVCLAY